MSETWNGVDVIDTDHHFIVDAFTREITSKNPQKDILIKNDHNSERFTFEIPRYIEGRDVGKCNLVQVCYTNGRFSGVYTVDDVAIYPFVHDVLTCSWLISQNATKSTGKLSFMLRFAQVNDDATVEYAWSTKTYDNVRILETIDAIDRFEDEYVDAIQQWKNEMEAEMKVYVDQTVETQVDVAQITINKNDISTLKDDVAVQTARMDTFTALEEGSTTGDAELIDIRIGVDGTTYDSAGTAVRTQVKTVSSEIDELQELFVKTENIYTGVATAGSMDKTGLITYSDSATYFITDYYEVMPSSTYYRLKTSEGMLIGQYDENKTFLERTVIFSGDTSFETLPNCQYVILAIHGYDKTNQVVGRWITDEFIEYGSHTFALSELVDLQSIKYPRLKGKKWLFMGDSITYGAGATDKATTSYFAKAVEMSGAIGTNVGVSGSMIQYRGDNDAEYNSIWTLSKTIDFTQYDVVTIFSGTNDILKTVGDPDTSETETDMCGALKLSIANIMQSNPEIKLAVFTPVFRSRMNKGDGLNSDDNAHYGNYLYDIADKIEAICRTNHVPCKNLYRNFLLNRYNADILLADGLHPSDAGHLALANVICSFVSENLGL